MTYIITDPQTRVNENWANHSVSWEPVTCGYKDNLITGEPNDTRFQAEFYKHIALDIVTESVYNYPYPQITEKTLRPISCKRMFIVIGAPGTLELLHKKGFETFADVIDERYDVELDPVRRWHMICESIKNFVIKPMDEIRDIVYQHQETLEYNFQVLVNLETTECKFLNDTNT
jgi:hypothetical protein